MDASIIIPTYNGAKKIDRLLASLVKQSVQNFEVIVVIDGSKDNTEETLQKYKSAFNKFEIVRQENKGRAGARNAGAKMAQHQLLIFYDDDMEVSADSVQRHLEFHERAGHGCLVTGHQEELPASSDIEQYRKYLTRSWFSKYKSDLTRLEGDNLFFAAANCSMPKSCFEKLTGFDERLSDAEDYDLAFRALQQDIHVYFDKRNKSLHCDRVTCNMYIKRQRQYWTAKQIWNQIHQQQAFRKPQAVYKILYWPFASKLWVNTIDSQFFSIFPRMIRYRFYSMVIHSLSVVYPDIKLD